MSKPDLKEAKEYTVPTEESDLHALKVKLPKSVKPGHDKSVFEGGLGAIMSFRVEREAD